MNLLIPVFFIAVAGLYVQQTWDYDYVESVKFPYAVAVALICLSIAIAALEIRKRMQSPAAPSTWSPASLRGRNLNPLFLIVLTIAFAAALPVIKTLAALFLFVLGLRLVFRTVSLAGVLLDAVLIVVIFLVFHDLLLILLPSGPVEETLSSILRSGFK